MSRTEEIITWFKDAALEAAEVYEAFMEVIGQVPRLSLEIKADEEMLTVISNQVDALVMRESELEQRNRQLHEDIEEVKNKS